MAMRVLYLDVDDEITSAAARIRSAEEIRVAIVLPYGSRVATSRINFRLLSRDATTNGKRLSVVAGDAATRALAASAGLPVFASVAEYEAALEAERGASEAEADVPGDMAAGLAAAAAATDDMAPYPPTPAAVPPTPAASIEPSGAVKTGARRRKASATRVEDTARSTAPGLFDDEVAPAPATSAASPGALAAGTAASAPGAAGLRDARGGSIRGGPTRAAMAHPIERSPMAVPAERVVADTPREAGSRVTSVGTARSYGGSFARSPILIGLAVLALALVVGGVGAYLLLPSATVVITPRQAAIGPIEVRVVASPSATAPDPATKTVPAQTLTVDAQASGSFPVTGKRVEEKAARGAVRFRNKDFTSTNTIPRGSIVSTQGGIRFRTDRAVTVPRAQLVNLQIFPATASVNVTAVEGGPDGNVEPNTITVIPRGEDPLTLDVTNPDSTSGGKRDEFPRVVQADIDAATKSVQDQLRQDFDAKIADPALASGGSTVFAGTATLGAITFSVDPRTLLGKEVATFDLGASASGTVLAVDESSVTDVAGAEIAGHVDPGYRLVDGSSTVTPAPGEVGDGLVSFPVTITAAQTLIVDPAAVEAEIRGKTLADARTVLARYGQADLHVWPDWVGSIPTLDMRVDVRVQEPTP
jgi:hypothetical protein